MKSFKIQVASHLSGVSAPTIRIWEKRYKAVEPLRSESEHRLYSEQDIEKLALLSQLTELGQNIGTIARLSLDDLKKIYFKLKQEPFDRKRVLEKRGNHEIHQKILQSLLLSLDTFKIDVLAHELSKAVAELSPRELCLDVLVPMFQAVGTKVKEKELDISQEHIVSSLVTFNLGKMISENHERTFKREELILIAGPDGENHAIGILSASLLCLHYGYKFIFMGTSLPSSSLIQTAKALNAKAVLIGSTRSQLLPNLTLTQYLEQLVLGLPDKTEIWMGGDVFNLIQFDSKRHKIALIPSLQYLDQFLASQ